MHPAKAVYGLASRAVRFRTLEQNDERVAAILLGGALLLMLMLIDKERFPLVGRFRLCRDRRGRWRRICCDKKFQPGREFRGQGN